MYYYLKTNLIDMAGSLNVRKALYVKAKAEAEAKAHSCAKFRLPLHIPLSTAQLSNRRRLRPGLRELWFKCDNLA